MPAPSKEPKTKPAWASATILGATLWAIANALQEADLDVLVGMVEAEYLVAAKALAAIITAYGARRAVGPGAKGIK